jgi:hypothetical protein
VCLDEVADQVVVGVGGGPEHDPLRAGRERGVDAPSVSQAAPELDGDIDRGDDPASALQVDRAPLPRTIQIDHVEEPRALRHPARRGVHGIGVVRGLPLVVAAKQPHRPAAANIDRRIENQAAEQIRVKLDSRRRPAALDFSGWNWTPYRGVRSTAQAKRSP